MKKEGIISAFIIFLALAAGLMVFMKMKTEESPGSGQSDGTSVEQDPGRKDETQTPAPEGKIACKREFSPKFNAGPYYGGQLFDAHFHWPLSFEEREASFRHPVLGKDSTQDEIFCFMEKEKFAGAVVFFSPDFSRLDEDLMNASRAKKESPVGGLKWFLTYKDHNAAEIEGILSKEPELFDGIGEIIFYDPERRGAVPDDKISMEIYKVAEKYGLAVMLHPGSNQKVRVENVLKSNPNVRFLLHGLQTQGYILELMDKYDNVYYSLDSATLFYFDGLLVSGPKDKFVSTFEKEFGSILTSSVGTWKPRIDAHSDRFLWGTDRFTDWHYNEELSVLYEEFGRAFIGRLDPEDQENFAYKNSDNLFPGRD